MISPTMHISTSSLAGGGRFRKQSLRALPLYIACALLLLLYTQIDHFERFQHAPGQVLGRILAHQQPKQADVKGLFPKKIWQTWKVDPLEFAERDSNRARTWPHNNPGHRYEVLTDSNDLDYVETHFGPDGVVDRPDIIETYRTLNATIIKADLLRYLVMYAEGGVYADIDVENLRPVNTWIPQQLNETDVDLVVSVEIDEPDFANHTILGQKSRSFCQWTFMAKPKNPVMMRLIDHVLHWLNEVAQKQAVPISQIQLNFDEVITGTGPSAFTSAVLSEMTAQTHRTFPWDTFHALKSPILVGNILVLTVEAFAAGQGHSDSGNHDSPNALVKHHYHASLWPSRHPRYSHPAYGMVEECNWKPSCVWNWTENTAKWESLSYDDKIVAIQAKEKFDAERYDKEQAEKKEEEEKERERVAAELKEKCEANSFVHVEKVTAPPPEGESQSETHAPSEKEKEEQDKNSKEKPDEKEKEDEKQKPEEKEKEKPDEKQKEEGEKPDEKQKEEGEKPDEKQKELQEKPAGDKAPPGSEGAHK